MERAEPTQHAAHERRHHRPEPSAPRDAWGLSLRTDVPEARAAYERALHAYLGHRADTMAELERALCADSGLALGHVLRGFGLRFLARRDLLPSACVCADAARSSLQTRGGSAREHLLVEALEAFCADDTPRALARLETASRLNPECRLSMKALHGLAFMAGDLPTMQRGLERVLPRLDPSLPGHGYAHGCYAFVLEESGAYREAERHARHALALHGSDAWAFHALLHVHAMEDRSREGLVLARQRAGRFQQGNNFVAHLAWHHALFALREGQHHEALALYDDELSAVLGRDYRDAANCVSLLYRLERSGVAVGDRWERLAELALERTGDHQLAFADAHYVLALVRAQRPDEAAAFVERLARTASDGQGSDARVQRAVGLPVARAILADGAGRHALSSSIFAAVRKELWRLGGSRAQRGLFELLAGDARARAEASASAARDARGGALGLAGSAL